MHTVYQVHSLIKLTHQVESIAAYGDTLLVGTRQGHLFMYSLEQKESNCELTIMRTKMGFSKKPIQQLEVLAEQNLLISLTDNIVQLHDINAFSFTTLATIQKSKGATLFAVSTQKMISTSGVTYYATKLAVVVKRKLHLYYLKNNEFHNLCEDVALNAVPKSMVWNENVICLGYRDEYALLDLDPIKHTNLFPTSSSKSTDPCILLIPDSHFVLCRENQSILVNSSGDTEKNKSLKWSETPISLTYDSPYIIGVLTDAIEICSLEPTVSLQMLEDMPKVRFIARGKQGLNFAASFSQIWCLKMIDVPKQLDALLKAKEFQLALNLIPISEETNEEKRAKINEIQTLFAYDLFSRKEYSQSMKEFLKLNTDPHDVIRLYPNMLPQLQEEEIPSTDKDLTDKEVEESIAALSEYLTEMRTRTKASLEANSSTNKNNKLNQLMQIIDTILVKCYVQTKDAMVALILQQNYCHLAETEKILKKYDKFNDLIILYQLKGQHRKALELLQTEKGIEEESVEKTIRYLQKLGTEHVALILQFSDWILKKEPEMGLKIFTEDLPEVEKLPRPRILDTLLKEHSELATPYLEHVIHNWKDDNPLFHNALIYQYREKIVKTGLNSTEHLRKKLSAFLQKSTKYIPENVLKDFPTDMLLEERAIILGRLGKHDQAIALYVRGLGDVEKAKEYCEKIYEKGGPGRGQVFINLIKIILKPESYPLTLPGLILSPKTAQPNRDYALQLLEENAAKIDSVEIVEMLSALPDEIPVSRIQRFLSLALHKVLRERRREELLKSLLYAEHLQCQEIKLQLHSKHVLITEMNVCPVCKKRFANQAAVIWHPNGDVVHYACHKEN